MDTVWERLGGREFSLPLLFPSYFSDSPSLQSMPCWGSELFSLSQLSEDISEKDFDVFENRHPISMLDSPASMEFK
jgi:hypothetical protein